MEYNIYIGYDRREKQMAAMLEYSIKKHASKPININWIKKDELIKNRLYYRDEKGENHSTEFSMTRFLTPFLNKFKGWALFQDIDMLWLDDPVKLFERYNDNKKAVYCVKHDSYISKVSEKMDGKQQQNFPFKNYSSFMLFNCAHDDCKKLMPRAVSGTSPAYLHQFQWLSSIDNMGELPRNYNWLAGEENYPEETRINIQNLHFTLFHPELGNDNRNIWCPFANIWYQYYKETFGKDHPNYKIFLEGGNKTSPVEAINEPLGGGTFTEEEAKTIEKVLSKPATSTEKYKPIPEREGLDDSEENTSIFDEKEDKPAEDVPERENVRSMSARMKMGHFLRKKDSDK